MCYYEVLTELTGDIGENYYSIPWCQIPTKLIEKKASKIVKKQKAITPEGDIKSKSIVFVRELAEEPDSELYIQYPSDTCSEVIFVIDQSI